MDTLHAHAVALVAQFAVVHRQSSVRAPDPHHARSGAELGGDFLGGEVALSTQPSITILQSVCTPDHTHAPPVEAAALSRAISLLIEDCGDLVVGVIVEQPVDLLDHLFAGGPPLIGGKRPCKRQRPCGPAFEADVHAELTVLDQRDVLEQQRGHALALAMRGFGVAPQGREVPGQRQDPVALFLINEHAVAFALPLVLFLGFTQRAQLAVPSRLQLLGHQAVGGVHLHVAPLGQVHLVARPLHLTQAQRVGFFDALANLLVHGEGHVQGHRRDRFQQQRADRLIDRLAWNALTLGHGDALALAGADVLWMQAAAALAVAHRHPPSAQPAHDQPLQQRRTFTRRAPRLWGTALRVCFQLPTVALVFVPRDVGSVRVRDQRVPLLDRQLSCD